MLQRASCVWLCLAAIVAAPAWAAPNLQMIPPESAEAGVPFVVEYVFSWTGEPADWAIAPPALDEITWGAARVLDSRTSQTDGRNQLIYRVEFLADQPGQYTLPAAEFEYFRPEAALPPRASAEAVPPSRSAYPTLRSDPFPLEVRPKRTFSWMLGGLGALFVLSTISALTALWILVRRRNRAAAQNAQAGAPPETPLQRARRFRYDGDLYGYYQALLAATANLPQTDDASIVRRRLEERANAVGYKNERPSDAELDGDERDVARLLEGAAGEPPTPQQTRTTSLED